eukprot:TRINITY_DN2707_c0_g1_i1.p1 TRINITY_DN2707_c0_g1~~TRINITY_DN2707_c0_g1_i1.p1  ORF type:complete len:472 (+),score=80.49 TRINITY_DN2707_c0_g1_i1:67-1482(+)
MIHRLTVVVGRGHVVPVRWISAQPWSQASIMNEIFRVYPHYAPMSGSLQLFESNLCIWVHIDTNTVIPNPATVRFSPSPSNRLHLLPSLAFSPGIYPSQYPSKPQALIASPYPSSNYTSSNHTSSNHTSSKRPSSQNQPQHRMWNHSAGEQRFCDSDHAESHNTDEYAARDEQSKRSFTRRRKSQPHESQSCATESLSESRAKGLGDHVRDFGLLNQDSYRDANHSVPLDNLDRRDSRESAPFHVLRGDGHDLRQRESPFHLESQGQMPDLRLNYDTQQNQTHVNQHSNKVHSPNSNMEQHLNKQQQDRRSVRKKRNLPEKSPFYENSLQQKLILLKDVEKLPHSAKDEIRAFGKSCWLEYMILTSNKAKSSEDPNVHAGLMNEARAYFRAHPEFNRLLQPYYDRYDKRSVQQYVTNLTRGFAWYLIPGNRTKKIHRSDMFRKSKKPQPADCAFYDAETIADSDVGEYRIE